MCITCAGDGVAWPFFQVFEGARKLKQEQVGHFVSRSSPARVSESGSFRVNLRIEVVYGCLWWFSSKLEAQTYVQMLFT